MVRVEEMMELIVLKIIVQLSAIELHRFIRCMCTTSFMKRIQECGETSASCISEMNGYVLVPGEQLTFATLELSDEPLGLIGLLW